MSFEQLYNDEEMLMESDESMPGGQSNKQGRLGITAALLGALCLAVVVFSGFAHPHKSITTEGSMHTYSLLDSVSQGLQDSFKLLDLDNDGTITKSDIESLVTQQNATAGTPEFEIAVQSYMDAYGNLTYAQFAAKFSPPGADSTTVFDNPDDALQASFKLLDLDNDGIITKSDIEDLVAQQNITAGTPEFETAVTSYMDVYGDLNYEQFVVKFSPPAEDAGKVFSDPNDALQDSFKMFDFDNDGTITESDIEKLVLQLNATAGTEEYQIAVQSYMEAYGNLNYEQFVAKFTPSGANSTTA
jgi:Ca2+-binding EF-hand superfamily protein